MQESNRKQLLHQIMVMSLVLMVFACLGMYYHLWTTYSEEQTRQDDLSFQVDQFWSKVQAGAPQTPDDQEERLATAQRELEGQRNSFPTTIGSTEIMGILLSLAQENSVSLSLKTELISPRFNDIYTCDMFTSNVKASGSFADLQAFISHLEDGPIKTLTLEGVNISSSGKSWNADFKLTVFTQIPASNFMYEQT